MKSATVQEPASSHRMSVHDPPSSTPPIYSTRVRKPRRRAMPSTSASPAPASASLSPTAVPQPRTRTAEPRDRPSTSASPQTPSSPLPRSASPLPTLTHPSRPALRSDTPQEHTPDRSTTWDIAEISALAALVVERNSVALSDLVDRSDFTHADALAAKSSADLTAVLHHFRTPLDKSRIPFAPESDVTTMLAALAAEMDFMTAAKETRQAYDLKLAKARAERQKMEKSSERLLRELKFLADEVEEQRSKRSKLLERRISGEAKVDQQQRKMEKAKAQRAAQRQKLEKAKFAELETRRRYDRMRLKFAALRGEMVVPTVDQLEQNPLKFLEELDDTFSCTDIFPLIAVWEGMLMTRGPSFKPKAVVPLAYPRLSTEGTNSSLEKTDVEFSEDPEETQLELLRNRLAMVESEAKEWKETLESEQHTYMHLNGAKLRLEEELNRFKQPGNGKSGVGGRGSGKGNSNSRSTAAKLRAAARAAQVPLPESGMKKGMKKSRKGRPRRSLVPYV